VRNTHVRRLTIAAAAVVAASAGAASAAVAQGPRINLLSTRADVVSGRQVLTSIGLPPGTPGSQVKVSLNGKDVTSEFEMRPNGQFEGLLGPLQLGPNSVLASLARGGTATTTITDHPQSGPVFSGPQAQPWSCNSGATDAGCDVTPIYSYEYMPAGATSVGGFHQPVLVPASAL
jgi:hypothetical protein